MTWRENLGWLLAAALLTAGAVGAQETEEPAAEEPTEEIAEVIVVTASRTEQALNEAPAAITVLDVDMIESIPADDYGDLMRNIPGLNVSQTSARDINMTSRGSTNTLSTSQLVLIDGRSLYLDFFGFVMWDFLPVNTREIKQIEAVRGPGSAVWGANAMTGVVNLITKRPQEMTGTDVLVGGGELDTLFGSVSHAGVSGGNLGYKVSAGYYEQDAYDRPTGQVPGSNPPTAYPDFQNSGTEQPKVNLRLDKDIDDSSFLSFSGAWAGTDGIIHTGIGPFDIDSSSSLTSASAKYTRLAMSVGFFANFLDADSTNLLTRGADGNPLGFAFSSETYNLDFSNSQAAGMSNLLTYGGNYRKSDFDLQIAPGAEDRDEWGVFLQDEILLGSSLRWVIGGRYDEIDPLEDGIFTPRTSLLFTPVHRHTIRVSYNEAFRTPSAINNYLGVTILNQVGPLLIPAVAVGNVGLVEEHLTAYEIGYVGTFDSGLTLTLAAYENETEDTIDFFVQNTYGPTNPPPGVPPQVLPCFFIPPGTSPLCPLGGLAGVVPSSFSYRNVGEQTDRGVELSLNQRIGTAWNWFFNASWQDEPEFSADVDATSQNIPPEIRANLGLSWDGGRYFWSVNANYQDEAFWADVLNVRGSTDSFTQINAAFGMRFADDKVTAQVTGSNLTDERVLQHIFGDIISRKISAQVGFHF